MGGFEITYSPYKTCHKEPMPAAILTIQKTHVEAVLSTSVNV